MTEQGTPATRPLPTQEEIEKGKVMAILGYLCCFLIPLLAAKDNKFAMYHCEQAIAIFLLQIVGSVLAIVLVGYLIILFGYVLIIMGIIYAIQGKITPLPLIGKLGEKFNLVK